MFDLKWIRENPDVFDAARARRGLAPLAGRVLALDARNRKQLTNLQAMQERRNSVSRAIGAAIQSGKPDEAQVLKSEVAKLKAKMQEIEDFNRDLAAELNEILAAEPNLLDETVPEGADESCNQELRRVGTLPEFAFPAREHFELGEALGLMDFEGAARMSGARFVILKGPLARMERALAQFMLDMHTGEFGYIEVSPPLLVRDTALFGTGQLPKFGAEQFCTTSDHWLIPTAEVPLTNLVKDQILAEEALPVRVTAYTSCFRSEAGAAGKDTHGMMRHHQFYKVELVSIVHPEQSAEEHNRMTSCAEAVLQRLELPYRVVTLCSGDTGFSATKTYDIEVWLPGQNAYREISSCSNCGDFQARRMGARFRSRDGRTPRFVHTLNGSGVATGRALIAVIENYQRADGSILVPEVLRPYMGGIDVIGAGALHGQIQSST